MADVSMTIHIRGTGGDIAGIDTAIAPVPDALWVTVEGERAFDVRRAGRVLGKLSEEQAANLGERLHHAEWILTTDRAVVESRGVMHDCDECRAGTRRALRYMSEHPDTEMLVGTLYWAKEAP